VSRFVLSGRPSGAGLTRGASGPCFTCCGLKKTRPPPPFWGAFFFGARLALGAGGSWRADWRGGLAHGGTSSTVLCTVGQMGSRHSAGYLSLGSLYSSVVLSVLIPEALAHPSDLLTSAAKSSGPGGASERFDVSGSIAGLQTGISRTVSNIAKKC